MAALAVRQRRIAAACSRPMNIVPATQEDAADIRRLLALSDLPPVELGPAALKHFLVLREGRALVAVAGYSLVGKDALLHSVAVSRSLQGGGVGRQMVAAAEAHAGQEGARKLYLLTTTAYHYFAKLGFQHTPRMLAPEGIREMALFRSLHPSSSSFMVKPLEQKPLNVLFVCTGNSARSILAEAILNHLSGRGRFKAYSAGSHPKPEPHPYAMRMLSENNIPTEGLYSKDWAEFAKPDSPRLDFVFTVCDKAAGEQCPYWPGQPMSAHWGVPDPAEVEGSDQDKRRAFNDAFMVLKRRIDLFTALPISSLSEMALEQRIQEIGKQ